MNSAVQSWTPDPEASLPVSFLSDLLQMKATSVKKNLRKKKIVLCTNCLLLKLLAKQKSSIF